MAWHAGNFYIAPGATVAVWFSWNGADHGPQWVMPHPFPGEPEAWLVTERVGKTLVCEIGRLEINGPAQYSCGGTGSKYDYQVWIRNDGPSGCRFQIQGGGV